MNKQKYLIRLLQKKDKKAISLLYDNYASSLYGIILKIVRSEELAEDVLQDAFIKIWKNGPSYNEKRGSLFTWMLNIARNTAIDKTRSAHFRASNNINEIDQKITNNINWSHQPKPEHIGLNQVITKLDNKYVEIIELIYFKGYTQQEVHEHLDIPLGTVKSRLRIALRELRKIFDLYKVPIIILLSFLHF